jgi:hypothetical protein
MKTKKKNNLAKLKLQSQHHPPTPKRMSFNTLEECLLKIAKPSTRRCLLKWIFRQLEADGLAKSGWIARYNVH